MYVFSCSQQYYTLIAPAQDKKYRNKWPKVIQIGAGGRSPMAMDPLSRFVPCALYQSSVNNNNTRFQNEGALSVNGVLPFSKTVADYGFALTLAL